MSRSIIVYDDPIGKPRPRATVRGGRASVYTPSTAKDAEWRIQDTWIKEHGECLNAGPILLQVVAYLQMPKAIAKKRRATAVPLTKPDTANLLALVSDALEGCAYLDDKQVLVASCTKVYTETRPRWVITVTELKEDDLAYPA